MSGIQYLFGNVDEQGKLEETSNLDKELLDTLEQGGEYLESILSSNLHLSVGGIERGEFIKPNKDAQDYSEIQELAMEEEHDEMEIQLPTPVALDSFFKSLVQPAQPQPLQVAQVGTKNKIESFDKERLSQIVSDVKKGKIRFTEIFGPRSHPNKPKQEEMLVPDKRAIIKIEDEGYKIGPDARDLFFKETESIEENLESIPILLATNDITLVDKGIEKSYLPIELDTWEKRIIWDPDMTLKDEEVECGYQKMGMFRNQELDRGDWLDHVLFDEGIQYKIEKTFDDPAITLDVQTIPTQEHTTLKVNKGKQLDRFNISDDNLYEQIKSNKSDRVRQVAGPVVIEHALPAIKLNFHYFKPHLTTRELRYFHRSTIRFPLNQDIKFNRLKLFKKKKARGKDPSELMKHPKNITLKDTCQYVLLEYSEEYPPIIQNPGMASMIYNYYRKKDEKDNFVPKMANGAAYVLDAVDSSPFFGFGNVEPGQTMQAVYNHMFRAPIFKHEIPSTDFLLIKHSYKGKVRYYVREIQNVYVTGQLFPTQEVPRAKSRRVLHLTRNRILGVAFRMMHRDPLLRVKFVSLHKIFPGYTELELRNKIKDFLNYAKKGENTGWWKLNAKTPLPNEDGIRKFITPEMVCLMESALAGQQRLNDSGYGNVEFNENDEGAEEATGDIEVMMAPWVTTKNFITAAAGKGMVQLHGQGDPSGCGEAFSFLRASMKEMFFRQGESENSKSAFIEEKKKTVFHRFSIVEQQQVYRSEIARIWKNQLTSLGYVDDRNKNGKQKAKIVELKANESVEDEASQRVLDSSVTSTPMPMSPSANASKEADAYSDVDDTQSIATSHALGGKNRILVINRLVVDPSTESLVWKSEVITDVKVMRAYLRQRALLERISKDGSQPPMTEEDEKLYRKRKIQDYLTNLRLSRRGKRKEVDADLVDDGSTTTVKIPMPSTSTTKRRKSEGPEQVASMKLVLKRRAPEVELNQLLDKLIKQLISLPESWPFTKPVSSEHFQDYYEIIKNPKTLQDIQEDINKTKYYSSDDFISDLKLIASNCRLYNGNHPLTSIAEGLVDKGNAFIKENQSKVDHLHELIAKETLNVIPEETPATSVVDSEQKDLVVESNPPTVPSMDQESSVQTVTATATPIQDEEEQFVEEEEQVVEEEEQVMGDGFVF